MTTKDKTLETIKSKLQKIAADIPEVDPVAAPETQPAPSSPQEVLSLVEEAIDILDTAAEGIPAERGTEEPAPAAPAMAKKAKEDDEDDEDDNEMTAKLQSRIAALEEENTSIKKAKVAEEIANLYNEDVRKAKYDEIVQSKETLEVLTAKLEALKDLSSSTQSKPTYNPSKKDGYLTRKASLENRIPEWRY